MSSNDMTEQIVDGFMRYVRKTPPCENVSITTAYATKLCQRIKAAHKREIAELRECLKEAIREKCPFTRMSCKHGEPCEYECGTKKWRKTLEGANNEGK